MAKKQTKKTKPHQPPSRHSKGAALKVYWPYLPMLLLLIGGLFLNVWQPLQLNHKATLAYATEMSRGGLLSGTNSQRASNGKAALTLNTQLNSAAQAKANDMVTRDYWSHNTPDGNPPWVFIDAQGYNYQKAGENLAYGFNTSSDTIVGWMNSPSHKANLLDSTFTEVGFGFANSPNYVNTGEETVVVAMYAKPTYVAPPAPTPAPVSTPQTQPATVTQAPEPEPTPSAAPAEEPEEPAEEELTQEPITTDSPVPQDGESQRITKAQQLTDGNAPWIAVLISSIGFGLALIWIAKHYVLVRRFIIEGEHFVAHHPVLDLIVVIVIAVLVYLSQSTGVVI
jgi:uncharacterized protein YkwD